MTQVTTRRKEIYNKAIMRLAKSLNWQRKMLVFAGVFFAFMFDSLVNRRVRHVTFDIYELTWLFWLTLGGMALFLCAVLLERYVRPLSTVGALSTGFCGYALASFIWPVSGF